MPPKNNIQSARSRSARAAFFGYSWSRDQRPDGYMFENIQAIRQLGIDVDLYLGNHFTDRRGIIGVSPAISPSRLGRHIRTQKYDFAVSFNNAMIMPEVVEALDCRPVSVIVDSEQHLFDHSEKGGFSAFDLDICIAPIYSSLEQDIAKLYPEALDRFHFIPPATRIQEHGLGNGLNTFQYNISWIASLVGDSALDGLIRHITHAPNLVKTVMRCLDQIAITGYLDAEREKLDVIDLTKTLEWEMDFLEMHLQNIVTNNERVAVLDDLAPRGLRLFGNDRWKSLLSHNVGAMHTLAMGEQISTHADQMNVYNKSRISINIPQAQAKTGIQYRVFDVMASRALLLTRHVEGSDLYRIFPDFPVPRFTSRHDLVKLVDHYLANEGERLDLVAHCNALLTKDFSFVRRAEDYLALSNPGALAGLPRRFTRGVLRSIDRAMFTNWTGPR